MIDPGFDKKKLMQGKYLMTYLGNCFCGAVEVEVTGSPEAMGYCHCRSCRSWSGGPVNAFSLWKPEAVRITAGSQHVATFAKTEASERKFCTKCGGHLMTNHPGLGLRRRVYGNDSNSRFHARRSRQLRRSRAADARRVAEAEGLPGRVRRLRRGHGRVKNRSSDNGCERRTAFAARRFANLRRQSSDFRRFAIQEDRRSRPIHHRHA